MAVNEWGHAVLCTALGVVDDTALVSKTIVSELKVGSIHVWDLSMKMLFMCSLFVPWIQIYGSL